MTEGRAGAELIRDDDAPAKYTTIWIDKCGIYLHEVSAPLLHLTQVRERGLLRVL
jgi:hypothetical protein